LRSRTSDTIPSGDSDAPQLEGRQALPAIALGFGCFFFFFFFFYSLLRPEP